MTIRASDDGEHGRDTMVRARPLPGLTLGLAVGADAVELELVSHELHEDATEVDQKVGMSRNCVDCSTDKHGLH
jgi:hypothetical protein